MSAKVQQRKLFIVGDSAFAEVAYEYFLRDQNFEVAGFIVEEKYISKKILFGLPIIPLESLTSVSSSDEYYFYVAIVYSSLNRLRTRLYHHMKSLGFKAASYISSNAHISPSAIIGEHCFIFEGNNIQPFAKVGNNVVLWSGNHIGHHSSIEDNCFISSHVVISGFCQIGVNTFIGVNATISNNLTIGKDNWIGPRVLITKDTGPNLLFKESQEVASRVSPLRFFGIKNGVE